MNKNQIARVLGISLISTFILNGCSMSGKKLNDYPRQEVERPYTLPDGIKTYEIWTSTILSSQKSITILINPLYWQYPINDNLTLLWLPLPLGLKYQLVHTEHHTWGISAGYALLGGFASTDYKYKFNKKWAFTPGLKYSKIDFPFILYMESMDYTGGVMWQVTDKWALQTTYTRSKITTKQRFLELILSAFSMGSLNLDTTTDYYTNTYSLNNYISMARQWDLDVGISMITIDGYTDKPYFSGNLKLIHYWD